MEINRSRPYYAFLIVLIIGLGLLSRWEVVPSVLYGYLGDFLYAVMIFFLVAFLFPKLPSIKVLLFSLSFCYLIEFSQLYQAGWIKTIRAYKLGGLILGHGFLWSDILIYTFGGLMAYSLEKFMMAKQKL